MPSRCSAHALLVVAAGMLANACHGGCEDDSVAPGTQYRLTVVSASTDCPDLVPLKAGDTLTLEAGPVSDDGICKGNGSTGLPAEFPQYPVSPVTVGNCTDGESGYLGFSYAAIAPDCGNAQVQQGTLRAWVDHVPPTDRTVINTDYRVQVHVGGTLSCAQSCFTQIPVTLQKI